MPAAHGAEGAWQFPSPSPSAIAADRGRADTSCGEAEATGVVTQWKHQWIKFKLDPRGILVCFYDHACRPRLEKLLCLELPRSPGGFFYTILDPGGSFRSKTDVAKPFQN
jgi:hypothetical protein